MWYRLGAGAAAKETTTATVAVGGAAVGSATTGGAVLEPPEGGGEKRRTRGWKALPPRVFAMLKPEMEEKGVGEGEFSETGNGKWIENERKEFGFIKGEGAIERSRIIKGPIKWMEQKNREINGGLRKRRVCSRWKVTEMNSGSANFHTLQNFRSLENFQAEIYSLAHVTPAKQKTKNCVETNL